MACLSPAEVLAACEAVMLRPFVWGPCDCCSAACAVFERLHGINPMAPLPAYASASGAYRVIAARGGWLAMTEVLAASAGLSGGHAVGGLALSSEVGGRRSLLICIEPGLWAGKSDSGLTLVREAERGWHAQAQNGAASEHGAHLVAAR